MPRRISRTMSTMITMTTMVPIPMYTGVVPLSRWCVPSQAAGQGSGYPGDRAQNPLRSRRSRLAGHGERSGQLSVAARAG